ncbi:hypothetical protein DFH09DRAFT_934378 [Mycena vulgaris]|nr:hypothetical protein DFH09DRAFT_934378 [Mycena vulgaris]
MTRNHSHRPRAGSLASISRHTLVLVLLICAAGYVLFASWGPGTGTGAGAGAGREGRYQPVRPGAGRLSSSSGPARLLDVLYPAVPDSESSERLWIPRTQKALRALLLCMDRGTCGRNQEKVVILQSMYFFKNMGGDNGGEEIWCVRAAMLALTNLGYTVVYTQTMAEAAQTYRMIPELVKMLMVDEWQAFACWKDGSQCRKTAQNPTGIPAHKIFSFCYWPHPRNPLGAKWVLSPEPYHLDPGSPNTTYLGYSIEHACAATPFVPAAARPNQAWILAKLLAYLAPGQAPWTAGDYDAAARLTGVQWALGAGPGEDGKAPPPGVQLPATYVNHGRSTKDVFMRRIAQSRVLVGVGRPILSPTPWDALCLGVPFIHPLDGWDADNPDDSTRWHGQHQFVGMLGKPYVYSVRRGDHAGFVHAMQEALSHPIGRYVPDRMRISAVEERLEAIVDHDWAEEERRQAEWCHEPCGCAKPRECSLP